MSRDKSMLITVGLSSFLFLFVIILIYLVYCFAYYDDNQKSIFIDKINNKKYDFVYENMVNNDKLSLNEFYKVLNLMNDKEKLKIIYDKYYSDKDLYKDEEEFINTYYYGDSEIIEENVSFGEVGKTSLFKRKRFYFENIDVINNSNNKVSLGIKNDIMLNVEDNVIIVVDDKEINCVSNNCNIDYIFGGLHLVFYKSSNLEYIGILNIDRNGQIIDITNLDNLVKISK